VNAVERRRVKLLVVLVVVASCWPPRPRSRPPIQVEELLLVPLRVLLMLLRLAMVLKHAPLQAPARVRGARF
jgi:hypothetical protein